MLSQEEPFFSQRWKELIPAATSAVVVIVRGLGPQSFREIIYYDPTPLDRSCLETLIMKVENCGAKVNNIVCDMGNTHLQKQLNMYEGNYWIRNPARPSAKIFLTPDASHSIKNLKSNIFKYGCKVNWKGKEVKLEKRDFIRLKVRDAAPGQMQTLHKIKSKHFSSSGHQQQSVSSACQIFSSTYAAAFRLNGEEEKAEVVQCVNNWFDTMNSRTKMYKPDDESAGVNKYKSALGTYWPVQEQALLQMLELMEGLVRNNYNISWDRDVNMSRVKILLPGQA